MVSPVLYVTLEQYLASEEISPYKSEYVNGAIYAMAGGSFNHSVISGNAFFEVARQLRGRPCRVLNGDMLIQIAATSTFTYPDLSVACGEPQFSDARQRAITNPIALFEILSPSTEAYDRGAKFAHYRKLDSLEQYVLISQERPIIEVFTRVEGVWQFGDARGLDAQIELSAISCILALADVYSGISFEFNATDTNTDGATNA